MYQSCTIHSGKTPSDQWVYNYKSSLRSILFNPYLIHNKLLIMVDQPTINAGAEGTVASRNMSKCRGEDHRFWAI